ncbi:hypothetical protein V7S57_02335 [Caulobacter sp. CCNWLY153]|uniref:hypothetical protein n=1 Tax=unclassified Caulobacter TaxID=2648921 RepID=UPI002FF14EB2
MALKLPPEEIPTADAIAAAVVAVAKVTKEDPLAIGPGVLRPRLTWPVLKALKIYYAAVSLNRLGSYLGVDSNASPRLAGAEKGSWWPVFGAQGFEAACAALENF